MNTKIARRIAEERHKYMEDYLDRFYKEWEGEL
ncbi:MAG: phosphohydrolase, partial [Nitrospirota bacterium]